MLNYLLLLMRFESYQPRRKAYACLAIETQPFYGFKAGAYEIRHLASPNGRFPVIN